MKSPLNRLCALAAAAVLVGAFDFTARPQSTWQLLHPTPTPHPLLGVAHGNGQFVAVGENGTILSSPDAITWVSAAATANRP